MVRSEQTSSGSCPKKRFRIATITSSDEEAVLSSVVADPDCIVIGTGLFGQMDRITAARYIFSFSHIAVVFLTGPCDDLLLERVKKLKRTGVLKPLTEKDVVRMVLSRSITMK